MNQNNNGNQSDPTPNEPHRSFEADVPNSPRKEQRRGSFANSFEPRRESTSARRGGSFQNQSAPQETPEHPAAHPATSHSGYTEAPRMEFRNPTDVGFEQFRLVSLLIVMVPLAIFAFWPSLVDMVTTWYNQVDYGHGFFVIPLVALFLYLRLDTYPGTHRGLTWIGLLPILVCCGMRYFAASQYMDALDQWSLLLWILGVVWFFYGSRVFLWALPSLLYLVFMFPLPYRYEVLLRNYLQQFAAQAAAVILQLLGETAIPIKNTIRLSSTELGVEAACSGIRFLVSILAIAFAAILLMRRPWWQNILVFAIAIPLALFVNAARIAMTGILILHFSPMLETWAKPPKSVSGLADEIAGITMIFVAVGIFSAFLIYLGKLFRRVEL